MDTLRSLLAENAPLRLFLIVVVGYLLGQVRIRSVGLGVAGVLFAGLAAGAWGGKEFALPEMVSVLGLAVFIYTLGLQAGPGFFSAFRSDGLRLVILTAGAVLTGVVVIAAAVFLLDVPSGTAVGLFCGGLTNTPALAATLDQLRQLKPAGDPSLFTPAVGYSIAYPFGVLGLVLAAQLGVKLLKIDVPREREEYDRRHGPGELVVLNLRVTRRKPNGNYLEACWVTERSGAVLTRVRHEGVTEIVTPESVLQPGDVVVALGNKEAIDRALEIIGEVTEEHLEISRPDIALRRVLVSNAQVAGKSIQALQLEAYGALITRVRRGDVEVAGTPSTVLELGDRVRVIAYSSTLEKVTKLLGDSIKTIAETDLLPLAFGLSVGVLVGMIPIPMASGVPFRLGSAGGPLIVALILGRLGKTGRIIWGLPMEVNFTLRQFGLILFLAAVGVRAGSEILEPLGTEGPRLLAIGCAVTLSVAATTLIVGRLALKLNVVELLGVLSGVHTQPAALAFSSRLTGSDGTSLAYAGTHPVATIIKIIVAQALIAWLPG